jgi:group II intron reverse transcriptase/maturase
MLSDRTSKRLDGITTCSRNQVKAKRLFQLMTNYPDLWIEAYARIQGNKGATTPGIDKNDTLDGMSPKRIKALIENIKAGTYVPKPVRRIHIPKKGNPSKKRPLGIPGGNDKLVQSVIKIILEQIYEETFSELSHGFRPNRSCHTALKQIQRNWTSTKWLVEVDIKGYFDNINHAKLVEILGKRIDDWKFINLIKKFLRAGYMEDWQYRGTYSGTPQGGIVSPVLANIYLNELDEWAKSKISNFDKGIKRQGNRNYLGSIQRRNRRRMSLAKRKEAGKDYAKILNQIKEDEKQILNTPPFDGNDSNFRRMKYCRYADDFVIGIIGSKEDAKRIKKELEGFLKTELMLETSAEKTKISHAEDGMSFLGYNVRTLRDPRVTKSVMVNGKPTVKRTISGGIILEVPVEKIRDFANSHGVGDYDTLRATDRPAIANRTDTEILSTYNAELAGFAQYYKLAGRVKNQLSRLQWLYDESLHRTFGRKYKSPVTTIARRFVCNHKFTVTYETAKGARTMKQFRVTELAKAARVWNVDITPQTYMFTTAVTTLDQRIMAKECALCGSAENVQVHHIRRMKDVQGKKHFWQQIMAAMNRKTLAVCRKCHMSDIHAGKSTRSNSNKG